MKRSAIINRDGLSSSIWWFRHYGSSLFTIMCINFIPLARLSNKHFIGDFLCMYGTYLITYRTATIKSCKNCRMLVLSSVQNKNIVKSMDNGKQRNCKRYKLWSGSGKGNHVIYFSRYKRYGPISR